MIYIGTVSFNTLKDLPECIRCVKNQSYKKIRLIVFDNNSSDNSVAWLKKQKQVRVIAHNQNVGFGNGHNAIIAAAKLKKNDYYLALNPDVRLDPNYVKEILAVCRKHQAGWATGKLYKDSQHKIIYSVGHGLLRDGYATNIGYNMTDQPQWDKAQEIFGAPGAAPLYSAKLIRAISVNKAFFDRKMFMYYEDVDLDWRARLAGFHCWYTPKATAIHPGGGFRKKFAIEALGNRYRGVLKNAMWLDLILYNLPIMFAHLVSRLLITPKDGWKLISKVARIFFVSLIERSKRKVSRKYMNQWFLWSSKQFTNQPTNIIGRLQTFWRESY